jgi:uncharacterized membrane protein
MQMISRFVRNHGSRQHSFHDADRRYLAHPQQGLHPRGTGSATLAALIPDNLASRTTMTAVLEVLLIALACFLAGLFARTVSAQRIVRELEMSVLSKVPGYEYMKHAGASMLGVDETAEYPVVLANLGGAWRIGVQTDELSENLVAVFVPNSPNPLFGGAFLIAADRLRPAGVSLAAAMGALRRCSAGSGTLFSELAAIGPT